jgi:hypothetical protein
MQFSGLTRNVLIASKSKSEMTEEELRKPKEDNSTPYAAQEDAYS